MNASLSLKQNDGNYFDDFKIGQVLQHGVPRTITESDATLYLALTGNRFALNCALTVAEQCGFSSMPLDNFLVFHIAFGKTVNDISLNAVANLGYAEVRFSRPCYAGDTLTVTSEVIGLKLNSSGKNGVVYVHSKALNQNSETVVSWKRWVMVNAKTDGLKNTQQPQIPQLLSSVSDEIPAIPSAIDCSSWQNYLSDSQDRLENFAVGDKIVHRDGITINHSEHSMATRLYQNNARVHFDGAFMQDSANGQRLVYGGHIISICRALSYNGLGNGLWVSSINGGSHTNPSFAGDTIYSQSEILEVKTIEGREDLGLLRIRQIGTKNIAPETIAQVSEVKNNRTTYHPSVVLDLDFNLVMLR
jgi:2-methylfumaryl-CoA hydratase